MEPSRQGYRSLDSERGREGVGSVVWRGGGADAEDRRNHSAKYGF
jgi:hypothetical protein